MQLKLSLLGSFTATLDGKLVHAFESDKVRALLAYLAVEADRPHRREALTGMLWPEKLESTARHSLNQALYNLRQALGNHNRSAASLLTTSDTVQFCLGDGDWVDMTEFKRLMECCEQHPPHPHTACGECKTRLEQAAALYRGDFLSDLSLKDSLAFEEWAMVTREQLRLKMQHALQQLARYCEQLGDCEQAIASASRLVEMDSLWEEGTRQLMGLLAKKGQRSAALAQYDRLKQALKHELGIEPEPSTQALAERLRNEATPQPIANNLPAFLTPFVGRQAELATLQECLQDPKCRLITLFGPGGSGKTRLAIEAARSLLDYFPDGVYLVLLNSLQSVEGLPAALSEALGLTLQAKNEPQSQLLNYLHSKQILLVMDGYDGLLEGASFAADILHTAPNCKILGTSRARLNVKGEHLFPLQGLDFPPLSADQAVTSYSAVQLFLEAAHRVNPIFDPSQSDMGAVAELCRLIQGMPLGVLLASAWMSIYTPQEIASEICTSLDFLSTEWRDIPSRQRSLRASFEYSWGLLNEPEQHILAGLSAFHTGFTRQAAHAVTGVAPYELLALVDKSLVQRSLEGRYQLHELVRQFAREKLQEDPKAEREMCARHCAHFAQALEHWEADLKSARQGAVLLEMDAEHENCRAAWHWASVQGEVDRLGQALDGLRRYYAYRNRYVEGESACQEAMDGLAHSPESPARLTLLARLHGWQSKLMHTRGASQAALALAERGLALLQSVLLAGQDIRREKAYLLLSKANYYENWDLAFQCKQESLALYRSVGDRWGTAQALIASASYMPYNLDMRYEKEEQWTRESLALFRELGDPRFIAECLNVLAWEYVFRGEVEQGERLIREAISLRKSIDEQDGTVYAYNRLATVLSWAGKFTEAHEYALQARQAYRELGNRTGEAFALILMSAQEAMLGEYAIARQHALEFIDLENDFGTSRRSPDILLVLGWAALGQQEYAEAEKWLEECHATWYRISEPPVEENKGLRAYQAYAALGKGRQQEALGYIHETLHDSVRGRSFMSICVALTTLALLWAREGQIERAIELYALARRYPFVANSRLIEELAGREVELAAACLPAEVAEAARRRGRARDLFATATQLLAALDDP